MTPYLSAPKNETPYIIPKKNLTNIPNLKWLSINEIYIYIFLISKKDIYSRSYLMKKHNAEQRVQNNPLYSTILKAITQLCTLSLSTILKWTLQPKSISFWSSPNLINFLPFNPWTIKAAGSCHLAKKFERKTESQLPMTKINNLPYQVILLMIFFFLVKTILLNHGLTMHDRTSL